ncbi:MAG: hypothetical protein HYZ49_01705 [Chloroflexi bacterium]|nr:hypothetical protein [Chloroflexota bacterium]
MTEIELKVNKLAKQVRQTQKEVQKLRWLFSPNRFIKSDQIKPGTFTSERARIRAAMVAAGLVREPTQLELQAAERWEKWSKKEQQRIRAALRAIKLDKPVSEIIIENRR